MLGLGVNINNFVSFSPTYDAGTLLHYKFADSTKLNTKLCADFVAANSEYLSNVSTDFDKGNEDFSFGGWFKFDNTATERVIGQYTSIGNRAYLIYKDATNIYLLISDDGTTTISTTGSAYITGTWYFVVAVYDSVNDLQKISVNGGAFNTTANALGCYAGGLADFEIANSDSIPFDGQADAPFFYNKALTLSEIQAIYNSGNGITYSDLTTLNGDTYAIASKFDGSTQWLSEAYDTTWNIAYTDFCYGGWFETSDTSVTQYLFSKWGASGFYVFRAYIVAGSLYVGYSSNGTSFSAMNLGAISNNTPYFLVVSKNDATATWSVSLNGGAFQTAVYSISSNKVEGIGLGASEAGAGKVVGRMQNWFAGKAQLDITEVAELYNSGAGLNYADVSAITKAKFEAWWDLDDIDGKTTFDDEVGLHSLTNNGLVSQTLGFVANTTITTIESSLVDWWKLDEVSGNRIGQLGHNLVDNNTVGSALGLPVETIAAGNNVYNVLDSSLNGSNSANEVVISQPIYNGSELVFLTNDSINVDTVKDSFTNTTTLNFRIKPTLAIPLANECIFSVYESATDYFEIIVNTAGKLLIRLVSSGVTRCNFISTNVLFTDNTYSDLTIQKTGDTELCDIYIDGVEVLGTNTPYSVLYWLHSFTSPDNVRLGCTNKGVEANFFNGSISSFYVNTQYKGVSFPFDMYIYNKL